MYIDRNLQVLRKRDRITQEDLADKLGVSRQSVSKWETGEAYPETDKLLMLCDLFGVSLDDLLRRDLSASALPEERSVPALENGRSEKASEIGYRAHMNGFIRFITLGVFLILFGVAACVALAGIASTLTDSLKTLTEIIAGVVVLLFVAAAVFLFVFGGISHDRFERLHPAIEPDFDERETAAFFRRFTAAVACLVSGILLDVVFLVIMLALIDAGMITVANAEAANGFIVSAFLLVLALIVSGLVYFGMQHSKYSISKNGEYPTKNKKGSKIADALCGIIMLSATALFLLLGFIGNLWHPGWVVFPIGGFLCGIVRIITDSVGKTE